MTEISNGFERHNIDHLSASSINLYSNAPDVWVASYLFCKRTQMGPAPWRGICVEDAVVQILMGDSETAAIDKALAKFDQRFVIGDEKTTAERRRIEPMTQLAVAELAQLGKPEFAEDEEHPQEKISDHSQGRRRLVDPSHWIPGSGLSAARRRHRSEDHRPHTKQPCRQSISFSALSTRKPRATWRLSSCTSAKRKPACWKTATRTSCWAQAKVQIARMEAFLRHCDKETALAIVPVQPSSFYWQGAEDLRKEFYGI
jgi:hypothetical protein